MIYRENSGRLTIGMRDEGKLLTRTRGGDDSRVLVCNTSNGIWYQMKMMDHDGTIWSKSSLIPAYLGLYLLVFVTSLEAQVTLNLVVFAASAFNAHSLISTIFVVQSVVFSVAKPIIAKVAHVFGRFEAFTLCIALLILGYSTSAASNGIQMFTVSSVFYSAGATGLQILQQIFIADTSNLQNRALLSTIPDVPFLANVWIGAPLASTLLDGPGWRWGYGIWAIVLPVTFIPLASSLLRERYKLRNTTIETSLFRKPSLKSLWYELDAGGLLLLTAAICLILIPLTLVSNGQGDAVDGLDKAMLVCGFLFLGAFPLWERSARLAPHPFFPPHLSRNRSVLAGFGIAFLFTMAYYLSVFPYFQSYLLVVKDESITTAGYIVQIYVFVSTVTAIVVSILIKFVRRYRLFVASGSCIYCLGVVFTAISRTEKAGSAIIVASQVIIGLGGGLLVVPAQLGVQASVDQSEVASTTALFLAMLEIGAAVGSSISGAIWRSNVLSKLQQYLPADTSDQALEIFGNLTLASTGWPDGSPTKTAIARSYQETMNKMMLVAACTCIPLVPLSLLMENHKLDEVCLVAMSLTCQYSDHGTLARQTD
ncbi:hypothetical protein ANO11243_083820 [Dothideomycetidae sp. 11243]|nr:hypothetical protein ANO11243_083820 [fungal sp. No.11243]